MNQIPYQLMYNPSQAQLLAMIKVSMETLKDYDLMLASNPMTDENYKTLKDVLPVVLSPLFRKSLLSSEFDAWVNVEQIRLNKINQ
jgi:hypothetical protein